MEVGILQKYLLVYDFKFAPKYSGTLYSFILSLFFYVIDTMYIFCILFLLKYDYILYIY